MTGFIRPSEGDKVRDATLAAAEPAAAAASASALKNAGYDRAGDDADTPVPLPASETGVRDSVVPLMRMRSDILAALETRRIVLVRGCGAGSGVVLGKLLWDAGWGDLGKSVAVVEASRSAALQGALVAKRMFKSAEDGVGHEVRYDRRRTARTRLLFTTAEAVLLRIRSEPLLSQHDVLVFAAPQTQSLEGDLLLALLSRVLAKRSDLRIVLLFHSAGSSCEAAVTDVFARVVAGRRAPGADEDEEEAAVCAAVGAVDVALPYTAHSEVFHIGEPCYAYRSSALAVVADIHREQQAGDVLVFLPTRADVAEAAASLRQNVFLGKDKARLQVLTLEAEGQRQHAAQQSPALLGWAGHRGSDSDLRSPDTRRVYVTNVDVEAAGCVLPLLGERGGPGLRRLYVVDAGMSVMRFVDLHGGYRRSVVTCASRAEVDARATLPRYAVSASGSTLSVLQTTTYRLFTEGCYKTQMPAHTPPPVLKRDLAPLVLQLVHLRVDNIAAFPFVTRPPRVVLEKAFEQLVSLRAIKEGGPGNGARLAGKAGCVGEYFVGFPSPDVNVACFVLATAKMGMQESGLKIAAMLSVQAGLFAPVTRRSAASRRQAVEETKAKYTVAEGDHLTLLNIYNAFEAEGHSSEWAAESGLLSGVLHRAVQLKKLFASALEAHHAAVEDWDTGELEAILEEERVSKGGSFDEGAAALLLCTMQAWFAHVAVRTPDGTCYQHVAAGADAQPLHLHLSSALHQTRPDWVIYSDVEEDASGEAPRVCMRDCARVSNPLWLLRLVPHFYERTGEKQGGTKRPRDAPLAEAADALQRRADRKRASNWLDVE